MVDKTDFYKRLNIATGASEEAIRKAYRLAARKAHPDVNKNEGATQLFLNIQEAYKVLSDPHKKETYDDGRDPGESVPNILTHNEYSQSALLRLEEPQTIYSLIDIVALSLLVVGARTQTHGWKWSSSCGAQYCTTSLLLVVLILCVMSMALTTSTYVRNDVMPLHLPASCSEGTPVPHAMPSVAKQLGNYMVTNKPKDLIYAHT